MDIPIGWTSFLLTTVILLHIGLPSVTCKDTSPETESVIDELLKKTLEAVTAEYDRKLETVTTELKATKEILGKATADQKAAAAELKAVSADQNVTRELLGKVMIALTLTSNADTNQSTLSSGRDDEHVIRRRHSDGAPDHVPSLSLNEVISLLNSMGNDGRDGRDGIDGINGKNGKNGKNGRDGNGVSGAVYTRWGKSSCEASAVLLYAGFAAGGYFDINGGGVDYQCLHLEPEYNSVSTLTQGFSAISGARYLNAGIFPDNYVQQSVPCARCYTPRSAVVMIPSRRSCPHGWAKEYEGYLMTSHHDNPHPTTFECVDQNPELLGFKADDGKSAVFHFVIRECGGISNCESDKQLTCVVCSK